MGKWHKEDQAYSGRVTSHPSREAAWVKEGTLEGGTRISLGALQLALDLKWAPWGLHKL